MKKQILNHELLLYPCPVMLVTTRHSSIDNVFTVSWTGIACSHPEYITISVKESRYSYELIKSSGCFTANIINDNLLAEADYCGAVSGRDLDKFKECRFTKIDGKTIDVPMIMECPVNIECKVDRIVPLGSHNLIIGKVMQKLIDVAVEDSDLHKYLNPVTYFRPNYYLLDKKVLGSYGKVAHY